MQGLCADSRLLVLYYFHTANLLNEDTGLLGYQGNYTVSPLEPNNTTLDIGTGGAVYYQDSVNNLTNFTDFDDYDDDLLFILINH